MNLSVIIPAYNPDPDRLRVTLLGLRTQTLPLSQWEIVIVNNASMRFPSAAFFHELAPGTIRILQEPILGLTHARRRGFRAAQGELAVLVDDDNVLAPGYLETVAKIFSEHRRLGAAGGKSIPRFSSEPAAWTAEFFPLLALRDLGEIEKISTGLRPLGSVQNVYPDFSPIGAGMALRRQAWSAWLEDSEERRGLSDRRGDALTSGGDNDIVLSTLRAGWDVGYFPQLSLTHLIPPARLEAAYLGRLNRGIQHSWMQVLTRHEANPWPALTRVGAALRKMKAYFRHRAWSSASARIRWQGDCGHFDGRVPDPHDR